MSAKYVGLAALVHAALTALEDNNTSLARGKLLEAMNLFANDAIDDEELRQFIQAEKYILERDMKTATGARYSESVSPKLIYRIIKDWQSFKPKI